MDSFFAPLLQNILRQAILWLSRTRLPQTKGSVQLPGLEEKVEVLRDAWGVPHIFAASLPAVLYAQGFVHAQDRLWQMEFQRRLVSGRLAEILGQEVVQVDRWMRTITLFRVAELDTRLIDAEILQLLQAYCAGINAFIKVGRLPVEFALLRFHPEPWQPVDVIGWGKMMAWTLAGNWESEYQRMRLIEHLGEEKFAELDLKAEDAWPVILDIPTGDQVLERLKSSLPQYFVGPSDGVGSNNWAISGQRTHSGLPIFANDMHLGLSIPAIWYENHLSCDGLNVTGVSLPGVPLVISGHNGHVAWGYTDNFADVQDLYQEHLRDTPDGKMEYEYQGQWLPTEEFSEEIRVKGGEIVHHKVTLTRHGPLINELIQPDPPESALALKWTALDPGGGLIRTLYQMNVASDCQTFYQALRGWTDPIQNIVYADTQGNIAFTAPGRVPIRTHGEGQLPVPGWTGAYEWTGYIPFENLPHIMNPSQGYLATANNRTTPADYDYFMGNDYVTGDRAQRIIELILAKEELDVDYIQRMQFDQVSPTGRILGAVIGGLSSPEPELQQVITRLRGWDGIMAASSPEAAVVQVYSRQLLQLLLSDRLGDLTADYMGKGVVPITNASNLLGFHALEWLQNQILDPHSAWFGDRREALLLEALRRTLSFLTREIGPDMSAWSWGHFHKLSFAHVLGRKQPLGAVFNRGPYPIGGDASTIWATVGHLHDLGGFTIVGPPFRFIADLSDLDHCLGLLGPGQSGHPASPHYADQIKAWFEGTYHVMLYQREEIEANHPQKLILMPKS